MTGLSSTHSRRSILNLSPAKFGESPAKAGILCAARRRTGAGAPSGDEFEVLYTSLERDGALAEIGYRLSLEPVWPSRIGHGVHLITVETERALRFVDLDGLAPLGVDAARYHTFEYQATQAIAAAAYFLEFDSLIVPSARFPCANLLSLPSGSPG